MNTSDSPDPWLGQCIGEQQRYRLDRPLGSGGVGDVYLAMDTRLGRRVAIKLLKGILAKSREILARFEREVMLSAALESEHIVQVLDYGVTPSGYPFYVMEYLQGQTLSQLIGRTGRLSVNRTISVGVQVCAGLKIAHEGVTLWREQAKVSEQVKVIHRDLKPANIFLVSTALGDLVKVLDFGIAKKLRTAEQDNQTNLTQAFLGTFRYAPPEQLRNARNLDERADIYSLGLILYEMLSGTNPFGINATTQKQAEISWAKAHTTSIPIPLRQQPGCDRLPAELEAVIMQCLCKRTEDRFPSVTALSQGLTAIAQIPHTATTTSGASSPISESTIIRPVVVPEDPTISRPLIPQAPNFVEETIVQSAAQNIQSLHNIQSPQNTQKPQNPVDRTIVQQPASGAPKADGTIVQMPHSSVPPQPDGTIVQTPPNLADGRTILQTPGKSGSRVDRTIVQAAPPAQFSAPDATLFQEKRQPAPVQPEQSREQSPFNKIQKTIISRPPDLEEWNRILHSLDQPSTWARLFSHHPALKSLVPIGMGFLAGLIMMGGLFFYFRSYWQTHQQHKQTLEEHNSQKVAQGNGDPDPLQF